MWHPLTIACLHDDGFSFSQIHQPPGAANLGDLQFDVHTFLGMERCQCGTPTIFLGEGELPMWHPFQRTCPNPHAGLCIPV